MENKSILGSQSSLGFFEIIMESFKTTSRNRKVLGPNLVFVFVSFSLLDFYQKYLVAPFAKDFVLQLANNPNMIQDFMYTIDKTIYARALKDIRVVVLVNLVIMASSYITTLAFLVTIISSSSAAYTAKVLEPKELNLAFLKSWKRSLVTSFYIILLTFGMVFLYSITIGITTILALNSWGLLVVGAIGLTFPVSYFYIASLWIVSMVVSVLEEDFGGVKAIERAADLMKGKRLQASLMMVLFVVACGVAYQIADSLTSTMLSKSTQLAIGIPLTNILFCMLTMFMFVVYTVFYHEWKTIHDEKEGKSFYFPIVVGEAN